MDQPLSHGPASWSSIHSAFSNVAGAMTERCCSIHSRDGPERERDRILACSTECAGTDTVGNQFTRLGPPRALGGARTRDPRRTTASCACRQSSSRSAHSFEPSWTSRNNPSPSLRRDRLFAPGRARAVRGIGSAISQTSAHSTSLFTSVTAPPQLLLRSLVNCHQNAEDSNRVRSTRLVVERACRTATLAATVEGLPVVECGRAWT